MKVRLGKLEAQLLAYCQMRKLEVVRTTELCGPLPRGYAWIRQELASGRVKAAELVRVAVRYGNQGTYRRLGVVLEQEGVRNALLRKLETAINSSKSVIALTPGRPRKGSFNKRWGVILNEQ